MKKILSLIMVLVLACVSFTACSRDPADNSSGDGLTYLERSYITGKDTSKPIDRYNKPERYKDIKEYVAPTYAEAFDPERQTLTGEEYYKLYSAITSSNSEFPGTLYYKGIFDSVNLADRMKNDVMINYMAYKYGNKVFSEEEVKALLGEKFVVTEYDLYTLKQSEYVDWQPTTNTYAFYIMDDVSAVGFNSNRDMYVGYRDMGENRYEFYFKDVHYSTLRGAVQGVDWVLMGEALERELKNVYATEKDGIIRYYETDYYRIETPRGTEYIAVKESEDGGCVVTLELKDGKIKLVDLQGIMHVNGPKTFPDVFSKIPTSNEVDYIAPTYREAFDSNRQTLTKAEYDKLYNAIIDNDDVFPGTKTYNNNIRDHVDLRQYSKNRAIKDYLYAQFGTKTFSEEELKNVLSEKFEITEYDIHCLKESLDVKWQSDTNTYTLADNYAEYKYGQFSTDYTTGWLSLYDTYLGYRDMGENKYEFYFRSTDPEKLATGMFGEHNEFNLTDDEKQQLKAMEATAVDGVVTYDGKKYYAVTWVSPANYPDPPTTDYWCLVEKDSYKVITLELKDGNIRLVDVWGGTVLPTTFSKIPTA